MTHRCGVCQKRLRAAPYAATCFFEDGSEKTGLGGAAPVDAARALVVVRYHEKCFKRKSRDYRRRQGKFA